MRNFMFFFIYSGDNGRGEGSIPIHNCLHMPHINEVKALAGRQVGVMSERVFISSWQEMSADDYSHFTGTVLGTPPVMSSDEMIDQLYGDSPFLVRADDGLHYVYELTNADWREVTPDNDKFKCHGAFTDRSQAITVCNRLHARLVLSGGLK